MTAAGGGDGGVPRPHDGRVTTAPPLAWLLAAFLVGTPAGPPPGPFGSFAEAAAWVRSTRGGVTDGRVTPHFLGDGPAFSYRRDGDPDGPRFLLCDPDAAPGTRVTPLFDHATLAAALADAGVMRAGGPLPFRSVALPGGAGGPVRFSAGGRRWAWDGETLAERGEADDGAESSGVERLMVVRRSVSGGGETGVTFVNATDRPVRLVWVSDSPRGYGAVPPGGRRAQHTFAGHVWLIEDEDGEPLAAFAATADPGVAVVDGSGPVPDPLRTQPTPPTAGSPRAFVRDGDVFVAADGDERRLTDRAAESVPDEFERVEYRRPRLSPDGKTVAAVRAAVARAADLVLVDPGEPGAARPETIRVPYPKPGDPVDALAPVFFDIETGDRTDVPDESFAGAYSLTRFAWSGDSRELRFLHNPRGHRFAQLLAADRGTGEVRVIIDERPETFFDYSQKTVLHDLGDGTLLWASERSGWNHLYRVDAATGGVVNAVTAGEWVVRGVEKIEEGRVWFAAGGVVPGQDPYFVHLCRVDFDGSGFVVLTSDDAEPGDGTHDWRFTPSGRFLIDRFSRVDLPPVSVLRDAETGRLVCELARADATEKFAAGWRPPERFAAPGRDGETMIYGHVVFPPGFDPAAAEPASVPIIENIYAGPHGAHVRKSWGDGRHVRELAALGFAVVRCDGMGTNWRSKAFHDVAWRNLADAGFPDRIAFLKSAAARWPALDLDRVGVYGGSAGGQNAVRAVLDFPETYHAAAADCGCHDNRVDKRWWNEAWLGPPSEKNGGPHYDASSNTAHAARLTRPVLLTVGLLDRNVDPASTLQLAHALNEAGKDYDLHVSPRGGHGSGESEVGRERRAAFFMRHLRP